MPHATDFALRFLERQAKEAKTELSRQRFAQLANEMRQKLNEKAGATCGNS